MALKLYRVGAYVYQFDEGKQPAGAEPVEPSEKQAAAPNKARKPAANKARKAKTGE